MPPTLVRLVGTAGLVLCLATAARAQEARQSIENIRFTGETGLAEEELKSLVLSHYGGLLPMARVTDVPETVIRLLRGEGFRQAKATPEAVPGGIPGRTSLVINVVAGPRTVITGLDVTGTSPLSAATVLARTGAFVNGPFREREISKGLAEIRAELRGKGYYRAIAIPRTVFLEGETQVNLTLQVDAGPEVEVNYLPSKSHLPRGPIADFIPITQEHSVDQDLLDDAVRAIELGLKRDGYWKATARHLESTPTPGRLVITFEITRGKRYRVERIEVPAGLQLSRASFEAEPALKPGEWFSEERVSAGLRRVIQANYWQNGYFEAFADPKFDEIAGPGTSEAGVIIHPGIVEGVKATVSDVTFDLEPSARVTAETLRRVVSSKPGGPYVVATALSDRAAIFLYYEDHGYLTATVGIEPTFNADRTQVALHFPPHEGPQIRVGSILVFGNTKLSRAEIIRTITLVEGAPYSETARIESQLRLMSTGNFRNAVITLEDRKEGETQQAISISVVEAPATSVGGGGGLEVANRSRTVEGGGEEDRLEVSPRAFAELTRRNLGGRNGSLSFFSRISLRPASAPGDPERDGKGFGFSEYRLSATYRERYAFQSDTDLLVGVTSEQAVRTTFNFVRQSFNADVVHQIRRRGISVTGGYALQFTDLFDERISQNERPDIDRLFPQVRLSFLSSGVAVDHRDDQIATTRGWFLSASGDLAMRQIGSEVGYTKTFMQGLYFRPLTATRRLVLALRAQLGLARGFEREVPQLEEDGDQLIGSDGRPIVEVVADLPASQRFFAGGGTTVRGFDVDRLGVTEILNADGLSNGGNGMVILNAELRAVLGNVLSRPFAVVGFVDSGNVFERAGHIDVGRLRGAVGLGARWDSPIGPLRFDLGRKLSQSIFASGKRESKWGWHFSLGQTF
jgi:outer membrane protein assembly factor BamA